MLYLVGSIVFSAYLTLSFKALQRLGISSFQAIVFNYWTCVITGSMVNGSFPLRGEKDLQVDWLPWALVMGTVFILLINVIAFTAKNIGVAVASVANKLSLIIPFLFSLMLYSESPSKGQVAGIVLALAAVVLTCYPSESQTTIRHKGRWVLIAPVILFAGSGSLDTMIKYVEQKFLNESNSDQFLVTAFGMSALLGSIVMIIRQWLGQERFQPRAILAGIMIGVPNYFSIWCLVNVLKLNPGASGMIIPVNNMGIVLLSAIAAFILFKERLSTLNWTGIFLSIIAISLIAFAK